MMMDKVENTLVDLMECLARCEGIEADTQQDILILMARLEGLEPRPQFRNSEHQDHKEGEGVKWYDYETRQAFSLPPAGVECETLIALQWHNCKVVGFDGPACVFAVDGGGYDGSLYMQDFRPLDWDREPCHRDKCIEAAEEECGGIVDAGAVIRHLYDIGWRPSNDKEGE